MNRYISLLRFVKNKGDSVCFFKRGFVWTIYNIIGLGGSSMLELAEFPFDFFIFGSVPDVVSFLFLLALLTIAF